MMTVDTMLKSAPGGMSERSAGDDVVVATVGRLVRNLRGEAFPGWSTAEGRARVAERLLPVLETMPGMIRNHFRAEMSELGYEERRALLVSKFLTPCMAARRGGCYVLIPSRRHFAFFVNEEEHLAIHAFRSGAACEGVARELMQMGERLGEKLPFAHDRSNGYLTSLPSEAGDGLQLYQVLHLPALTMAGMMPQVTRAADKLHVSISPFFADDNDDTGNTYVFFSLPGPEGSAGELTDYFSALMARLAERERQVRAKLQENSEDRLADCFGRAYGLLRYARRLSLKELHDTCSVLRLATVLGHLIWEGGADAGISLLRELSRFLSVQSALTPESGEDTLPQMRADVARRFLTETPHHFNTLYES